MLVYGQNKKGKKDETSNFYLTNIYWYPYISQNHINTHHIHNSRTYSVRVMVFNATFNNISVILWRSVLLVEETRVPGENH
jgi:hypothetical protein